jgi:SNF family Na+-dependent transporter
LKRKDDVVLSGLTASSMNEFFEVCLGGLITIPAAFVFLGVAAGTFGTFGMGFVALPNVFALMPAGRVFGFLWFVMLFLAAITSSLSMLQPVIAFFEEGLGLKRHASVAFLGLITALGSGFVIYFSKDMMALDTLDFWAGTMLIFVLAMIQSFLYAWVLGIDRGEKEMHEGAHLRIPRFVQYVLKFITPLYLLIIFAGVIWTKGPSYWITLTTKPVAGLSFGLIVLVLAFLICHGSHRGTALGSGRPIQQTPTKRPIRQIGGA